MTYSIFAKADISATIEEELLLSPEQFTYCKTEEELREAIREELLLLSGLFTEKVKWSYEEYKIPDEFIEEWKQLIKDDC